MTKRMFWLGLGGVAIACGGAAGRADPDQSTNGGSATGASATGGSATGGSTSGGVHAGGSNARGGNVAATGGITASSGAPSAEGGAAGAGAPGTGGLDGGGGAGGTAGAGPRTKDPIIVCGSNTLAGGIYCSKDAFCEAVECGKPWSLFDTEGCLRKICSSDDTCASGSRCVPAPVTGKFDAYCFWEYDTCQDSSGGCKCEQYFECGAYGVCLSEQEFPEERECPVEGLSCAELRSAAASLESYAEGDDFVPGAGGRSGALSGQVDACRAKVDGLLTNCN